MPKAHSWCHEQNAKYSKAKWNSTFCYWFSAVIANKRSVCFQLKRLKCFHMYVDSPRMALETVILPIKYGLLLLLYMLCIQRLETIILSILGSPTQSLLKSLTMSNDGIFRIILKCVSNWISKSMIATQYSKA